MLARTFAVGLVVSSFGLGGAQDADSPPPKNLEWSHGFDLACRKLKEEKFSDSTQKFGVEALRDLNTNLGLYLTANGSVALAPGFADLKLPRPEKEPGWVVGLDLPARKAGERDFAKAKTYCLEIYRDPHTDNCIYITTDDNVAVAPTKRKIDPDAGAPEFVHSIDLNVRKGGVEDWNGAAKVGIEIYRDVNTGNLVYVTDSGSIAVIPEVGQTKANNKAPAWMHGLDLAVRKSDEPKFSGKTRLVGVELFRDETNGNLIYLSETGSIAVIPGDDKLEAPTKNAKKPVWSHGWNVKVRRPGEKDFGERTKTYGGEVFRDDNVGALVTICETGAISATKAKSASN